MATDRPRIYAYVTDELRREAIDALRKGETMSDLVVAALRAEIERRKVSPEPSTSGAPLRLPRGRRPK